MTRYSYESTDGGMYPKWSDSELFYKERDAIMAVSTGRESGFDPGIPRKLFDAVDTGIEIYDGYGPLDHVYDVTRDGQRFVMIQSLERRESNVVVVEHWAAEFE